MQVGLSVFQPLSFDAAAASAAFPPALVNGLPFVVAAFLYSQTDRLLCFYVAD